MSARIVATFYTTDFRGDHAADVEICHEVQAGETVEALCARLFKDASSYSRPGSDYIALRLVQPATTEAR